MAGLSAIIVDDEETARLAVETALRDQADVQIVGQFADGLAAVDAIRTLRPDLVFLDVQMPGLTGLEVVEAVPPPERPAIVFVTGFERYAIRAFDLAAVDYLLKPFSTSRFQDALDRARARIWQDDFDVMQARLQRLFDYARAVGESTSLPSSEWPSRIVIKSEGDYHVLGMREVIWVEAQRDFVKVCAGGHTHLVRESLQQFERRLDPAIFSRVHRSFVVNLEHVRRIRAGRGGESTLLMSDGTRVPASRSFRLNLAAFANLPSEQILGFARAFEVRPTDPPESKP